MYARDVRHDVAVVELGPEDCRIIRQALNEVCNALDPAEFSTRMGADLQDVQDLLMRFQDLAKQMKL